MSDISEFIDIISSKIIKYHGISRNIIKYNEIGFILIIDKMSDEFKEIEYYISKIRSP